MNVADTKVKKVTSQTQIHVNKPLILTLRSRLKVMQMGKTPSLGDTPICQIWYAYVREQRRYGPHLILVKKTFNL